MRTTDVVQPLIASLLKSTFNLPSHSYPQKSEFHFRFHTHRPVPGLPRSKHHKLLQPVVVSFLDFPFLPDYLWSRVQFISSIDENFTAKNVLLPLFSSLSPLSSLLFSSRLSLPPAPFFLCTHTQFHFETRPRLSKILWLFDASPTILPWGVAPFFLAVIQGQDSRPHKDIYIYIHPGRMANNYRLSN